MEKIYKITSYWWIEEFLIDTQNTINTIIYRNAQAYYDKEYFIVKTNEINSLFWSYFTDKNLLNQKWLWIIRDLEKIIKNIKNNI